MNQAKWIPRTRRMHPENEIENERLMGPTRFERVIPAV